ncbi:MAG: sterol desaturase family protein [Devosiaceae bacterium]|nr:sterol desaturase family protein [Devosiaceae bacterium]
MEFLGLSESTIRLSFFIGIFIIMALLEAWLPRRKRRFSRVKRWTTNFAIIFTNFIAVFLVGLIVPITAVLSAIWAQQNGFGLFNLINMPIGLVYILGFLALDLTIWTQHLVFHKVPILWRLHRVHHSDEEIDASTALRFHPIEIVLSIFIKALVVILLGAPVILVVIFEIILNGSAMFNHANYKLPLWLDRILRTFIVTPDMHRIHHSVHHKETDSNYGFALSIWDHIFRTYIAQPKDGHEKMKIGLQWQDGASTRLFWSLKLPFVNPPASKKENSELVKTDRKPS